MVDFDDTVDAQNVPFEVKFNNKYENAFSRTNPPITIKATLNKIKWGVKDGTSYICDDYPLSVAPTSATFIREFVPYGCTYLRMTEIPVIKNK